MVNKNKYINRLWIPAFMLWFLVSSCSLQIDETDSLITEGASDIFNGVADPAASLTNIYNNISGQAGDQSNLYAMTEVTTDELLVPTRGTDWGDNGVWRTLHAHTWGSTHSQVLSVWNNKNSAVLRATEVIDPLSNASVAQVAEAKFARAYNMWVIMDFYGQVPFRNPTDGPEIIPSVMTRAEAYDLIVSDLEDAIADLPVSDAASADKTRPVKATARFWLAKVKLNAAVYLGAYGANDLSDVISLVDAIEAEGYALTSGNYFDIFVGPAYTNTDVIWSVNAGMANRAWNSLHYNQAHTDNGGGGWNGFTTLAEFYDKFEGPTADNSLGAGQEERRGYTQTLASTDAANQGFGFGFQLGQMYGWDGTSAIPLETRTGDPLVFTKELPGLIGNNEVTGMRLLKYSPANGAWTSGVVMARFADAFLMRAEAKMRSGDTGGALADVNILRGLRANTTALASLSEADMLDERARELYTEGWRRNDMIRFGTFSSAWQFKESGDNHTDLFPIPSNALLSNPGLIQNPGY
ncbi:MAG: RagB/SusD family nutrient uptake outer membrane protein [Cyclobacteriaceae bacterium]|nr:RagB/SusD family nutrient uptake outer membrane protein [Cyclobacteriaceae bacterium]